MNGRNLNALPGEGGSLDPERLALLDPAADSVQKPVSPFRALHRHLRGRYRWVLLLAALCAAGGAYAGWNLQEPKYRSEGLIRIAASLPSPRDPRGQNVLPMFRSFLELQVSMLESVRLAHGALKSEPWRETGEDSTTDAVPQFLERRSVILTGDSLIQIQFVDESPDIALAGVRALLASYDEFLTEENRKDDKLKQAATESADLELSLKEIDARILKVPAEFGGEEGLEIRHTTTLSQVLADEDLLRRVRGRIRRFSEGGPAPVDPVPTPFAPKSAGELALENPQFQAWMLEVELLKGKIDLRAQKFGEQDDQLVALRRELEVRNRLIEKLVEDTNARRKAEHGVHPVESKTGGDTLATLKAQEAAIEEHLESIRKDTQVYGVARVDLRRLRGERDEVAHKLDDLKQWKEELTSQLAGSGRIQVLYRGDRPVRAFRDRRKVSAVAGGLFGGALGVFIVLLFGLRDRRLKTSDDIGNSLSRLRLLGLMPELPSDLSDVQGGEIAAHCVHQIRTLLQIGHARDHGGAFCITGPGVGSGKTTLSFALGLSFGRSGTRTLLVDADLSGRGLTWRVSQMLLSHVKRLAGELGSSSPKAAGEEGRDPSRTLMETLALPKSPSDRTEIQALLDLLARSIDKSGVDAVIASGLVRDLFALVDLVSRAEGRSEFQWGVTTLLTSAYAGRGELPSSWIPPRIAELDRRHPDFNGTPFDRYVFPTPTETLRFLPLRGLGGAGGVSVETLTRILARVRKEFDIVLLDTGPVLGAVETSVLAAHADAVVFVVSPSDRRPDAELAAAQLEAVGARIAGVVFNRAAASDVLKSSKAHSILRDQGYPA